MHFLQELEEELKVYYLSYTETVDRPYSEQEQEIIVRIIKMLIRQLRGTSKFQLFSRRLLQLLLLSMLHGFHRHHFR